MTRARNEILREIPQIDELLRREGVREAGFGLAGGSFSSVVREAVADLRRGVLSGRLDRNLLKERLERLPDELRARIAGLAHSTLRPAVNATGIIVHTNLGRAPLPRGALERMLEISGVYSTLEYDTTRGTRGSRTGHLQRVAARLFQGRSLLAVNNNAAALMLVLNTLAEGREVLISRGELIEIGGSFRIPEIMQRGGALLREVGTTNRTRLEDYQAALGEKTGLILKVHTSNYKILGFTSEATIDELAVLGRERGVPMVVDQGSGALVDLSRFGIPEEPTVGALLGAGADLVLFSGDKVLGGPQAGLIVGDPELVRRCAGNHLARALRLDKTAIAALEWVLQRYAAGRELEDIPVLRMLSEPLASLRRRAKRLATRIEQATDGFYTIELTDGASMIGGGAAPLIDIPTRLIALTSAAHPVVELEERLRLGDPPIVARVQDGRLLIDPRTLLPGQDKVLVSALAAIATATVGSAG